MYFIDDIHKISEVVDNDGVIIHPTDTIWGLGCKVSSQNAYDRISEIKNREKNKPFILLVSDINMLLRYVPHLHPRIETLLSLHSRPLTIIYNDPIGLPSYALSNTGTIGIRIAQDQFNQELIKNLNEPLVSTSANFSGEPYPKSFSEIDPKLIAMVDYTAFYKRDDKKKGLPSVIAIYNKKGELDIIRE